MAKTLVAYFSASGVTRNAAELIARTAGADLYEICPAEPYTAADLNWRDKNSRSSREMRDKNSRPALADHPVNLQEYDTVLLGFPIWWYTAQMCIRDSPR